MWCQVLTPATVEGRFVRTRTMAVEQVGLIEVEWLYIFNQLTSLPTTIGELKCLTNLNCYENQLMSLPATMANSKV
jgi:hypothetical protein